MRFLQVNESVCYIWKHEKGIPQVGDVIEVIKGRKIPKGTQAKILQVKPIYDKYHRWIADYVYLSLGQSTKITNVKLIIK